MKKIFLLLFLFCSVVAFPQVAMISGGVPEAPPADDNMISNGTFATAADWTFTSPWSFSSTSALFTDELGSMALVQDSADMNTSVDSLTNYRLGLDITSTGSAGLSFSGTNSNTYVGPTLYADGSHILYWKTDDDWQGGGISIYASATTTTANFNLDNVTLTERELGAEMITNGTFTTDVSWIKGGSWDINSSVAGKAHYTDGSSNDLEQTDAVMVTSIAADTYYRITFTIGGSPTLAYFAIESETGQTYVAAGAGYTDGTYTIDFISPSDIGDGGLTLDTSSGGTVGNFTIDNISLKKWATD